MGCNYQVFKKPRGFIGVLKCLLGLSVACTTLAFYTKCEFSVPCTRRYNITVHITIKHPYRIQKLESLDFDEMQLDRLKCDNEKELMTMRNLKLPFDYSDTAALFATLGITSFAFTFAILIVCMLAEFVPGKTTKAHVFDFGLTTIFTLIWLTISSAWAQAALDILHYFDPKTLFNFLSICITNEEEEDHKCNILKQGSYDMLYASVTLGFANFMLWFCSLLFIYQEIIFYRQLDTETDTKKSTETEEVGKGLSKISSHDVDEDGADYD